ncbi:hypothetical protein BDQ12DRAFT_774462 [Crucibulum laeve]|uniref:F-box domain-containing protein n=1 Tax=Crucibulum laeve TaxID=68775 RepID=A0A5C3M5B7_9AGAR|nr:hypothetical protein BDQ12DRAFT_774462 [Crucibulum laeve]
MLKKRKLSKKDFAQHPQALNIGLPQELIDAILGFLREDQATLKACSLVCRRFTLCSQKYLFTTVELHPPLKSSTRTSGQKFQRLLELAPHVGRYVRVLKIVDGGPGADHHGGGWLTKDRSLSLFLDSFQDLISFTLSTADFARIYFVELPNKLRKAIQSLLWRCRSTIFYIEYNDIAQIPRALVQFQTALKHLVLNNVEFTDESSAGLLTADSSESGFEDPPHRPLLDTIQISMDFGFRSPVLCFFGILNSFDVSKLRRLSAFGLGDDDEQENIWKLMQTCSNSLEEIIISTPLEPDESWNPINLDLDPIQFNLLPNLKAITIITEVVNEDEFPPLNSLEWVAYRFGLFSSSNALEEVNLRVDFHVLDMDSDELDLSSLNKLDAILSDRKHFPFLRHVSLSFRASIMPIDEISGFIHALENRFSALLSQGIMPQIQELEGKAIDCLYDDFSFQID